MITSINHTICEKMREEEKIFYLIQTKHTPCHTLLWIKLHTRGTGVSSEVKTLRGSIFQAHRHGVTAKAASGHTVELWDCLLQICLLQI